VSNTLPPILTPTHHGAPQCGRGAGRTFAHFLSTIIQKENNALLACQEPSVALTILISEAFKQILRYKKIFVLFNEVLNLWIGVTVLTLVLDHLA